MGDAVAWLIVALVVMPTLFLAYRVIVVSRRGLRR